jgi:hypothetical protein
MSCDGTIFLDDGEDDYRCIPCGGPLTYLGRLGSFDHYRCRDCGFDHHWRA